MIEDGKYIVRQNRVRALLNLFVCAALTVGLFFAFRMDISVESVSNVPLLRMHPPTGLVFFRGLMFLCAVFSGFGTLMYIKKIALGKDVIIADDQGITNNGAGGSNFFAWVDIEDIHLRTITTSVGSGLSRSTSTQTVIEVRVKDKEKYLDEKHQRHKISWWRKFLPNMSSLLGYPAFCIDVRSTGIKPEIIVGGIRKMLKKYKPSYEECDQ